MKQVVFIGKERGCLTPEAQAEFLSKHAHLEGIARMTALNGVSKYYTYNGEGFRVMVIDDKVVQINKMDADEVKRIVSCAKLDFGGF